MPATYADIPLLIETPEVSTFLGDFLDPSEVVELETAGWLGYGIDFLRTPPQPPAPPPQLGVLYWPTGASRCATFHCVINSTKLDEIREAVDSNTFNDLVLSDGNEGQTITASMRMLPPRPLLQIADQEQLFLLSLVDIRYSWRDRVGSISSQPGSWSSLISTIATALGTAITPDTIDSGYGTPSERWVQHRKPLTTLLDAALATIGHRLVVALDGTVTTARYTTAQDDSDTQYEEVRKTAGGRVEQEDIRRVVPATVEVAFERDGSKVPYLLTRTLSVLAITGFDDATGVAADTHLLYADLIYDGTNAAAAAAYATQAAEDYYGWWLCDLDVTLPGIWNWEPTGAEDVIEWSYRPLEGSYGPRLWTRIRRGPWNEISPGGFSVVATRSAADCGWVAGIDADDCLKMEVVETHGLCSTIDDSQVVYLEWDSGDSRWESGATDWTSTGSGGTGQVIFGKSNGVPYLQIDGEYGTPLGCEDGELLFAFGGPVLCAGGTEEECNNFFVVSIACVCCPLVGWGGPDQWYCIQAAGDDCMTDDKFCVFLMDGDECNTDIQICDGPFDTEEDCEASCNPSPPTPLACAGKDYAADGATVTITEKTGGATCLDTTPLVGGQANDLVSWEDAGCGGFGYMAPRTMSCIGGFYSVTPGTGETWTFLGGDPTNLVWSVVFDASSIIGVGSCKVTITSP